MGYVARLQQFDTAAPWAPAPAAAPDPEPDNRPAALTSVLGVAAVPPHVADVVPAEVYEVRLPAQRSVGSALAPPEPPTFVARIPTSLPVARPRPRRRRLQAAVATVVALAGLGAVGVGYAAFTRTGNSTQAQAPALPEVPSIYGTLPDNGGVPGADPIATLPTSTPTSTAPTTKATTAATTTPPTATSTGTASTAAAVAPSPAGSSDTSESAPMLLRPAAPTAGTLEATLSYSAQWGDDGSISRYRGTIVLVSTKPNNAGAWRLTLTVPGGNPVIPHGPVTLSQDGESVLFTPGDGGVVPAGGTLTFTFNVRGILSDLPTNCTINGHSCS